METRKSNAPPAVTTTTTTASTVATTTASTVAITPTGKLSKSVWRRCTTPTRLNSPPPAEPRLTLATLPPIVAPTDEFASVPKERLSEAQRLIQRFWPCVMREIQQTVLIEGVQVVPLARIKKIMKLDEDVKMISSDAPLLFAKAIEIFIHELTLRAWLQTEHNKRRTLQRSDIAMAITKYDQFDFLIDIVPREEIKVYKKEYDEEEAGTAASGTGASAGAGESDVQYYLQLAQTPPQTLQHTQGKLPTTANGGTTVIELTTTPTPEQQPQHLTGVVTGGSSSSSSEPQGSAAQPAPVPVAIHTTAATQNIIFSNAGTVAASAAGATGTVSTGNSVGLQTVSTNQPLQLLQHVLTPSGEITQIPISIPQNQLNFLRAAGGTATNAANTAQPFFIQTAPMGTGPTIIHTSPGGVFLSTNQLQQIQQQQQQQQSQQQTQQQTQQQQQQQQQQTHSVQQQRD